MKGVLSTLGEFAGPPRSVIWRGGAVHLRSAAGPGRAPDPHAHFAIQLSIGLRGEVIAASGERASAWLVGSDQPHWLRTEGSVATIFFDPLTPDGRRLTGRLGNSAVAALGEGECLPARRELESCWECGWPAAHLRAAAGRIAAMLNPCAAAAVDARVQAVVDEMLRDASGSARLADLAAGVGLSESRLAHLFRQEVGIPVRQYRLTLRMEEAFACVLRGDTLTAAAHAAGFADSAHFCRVCRRMFGSAPSSLPGFRLHRPRPS
jgi:AraC-like DNA-binding protein